MLKEFREFAMRGNVMDMAIGIILGVAFGAIVSSAVNDVLMPPLGLLIGGVDFTELYINLSGTEFASLAEAREAGAATINYGVFLNTLLDFLIVALVIFLAVRQLNRWKREESSPPPEPDEKSCPHCAMAIPIAASRCPHCTSGLEGATA